MSARRQAMRDRIALADLVEPDDVDIVGTRCDVEWCRAFHRPDLDCGDSRGPYAGMVHFNRRERAAERAAWDPETFRPAAGR